MLVGQEHDRTYVQSRTHSEVGSRYVIADSAEQALTILEKEQFDRIVYVDHNSLKEGLALFSICKAQNKHGERIMITPFSDHKDIAPALSDNTLHQVIPKTWIRL